MMQMLSTRWPLRVLILKPYRIIAILSPLVALHSAPSSPCSCYFSRLAPGPAMMTERSHANSIPSGGSAVALAETGNDLMPAVSEARGLPLVDTDARRTVSACCQLGA